jgi:hypothetical protein
VVPGADVFAVEFGALLVGVPVDADCVAASSRFSLLLLIAEITDMFDSI